MDHLEADLLLRHGRIVTMDSDRRILVDGAIAIRAGALLLVGPDAEVVPQVRAKTMRDLGGAIAHPGFVNAHMHTSHGLIRTNMPEHTCDWWLGAEKAFRGTQSEEEEYLAALLSCLETVANGTTLFAETGSAFQLDAVARAIEDVGVRAMPGHFLADEDLGLDRFFTRTERCVELLAEQIERYPFRGAGRVKCAVALVGLGMASDELLLAASALAEKHHVPMIMHQSWEYKEVTASLARHGKRPIAHLADLGILGPRLTLVHCIHLDRTEMELIRDSGTRVVHCPGSALRWGLPVIRDGLFPEMIAAGITVAIGSDGHVARHDVAHEAYLATSLFRGTRADQAMEITAERALEMATVNGARVLDLDGQVGSLEAGKRADVVVHTLARPEAHPAVDDPIATLLHFSRSRTVDLVLIDGEVVFDHGRFTRIDTEAAFERIDRAARARAKASRVRPSTWPLAY